MRVGLDITQAVKRRGRGIARYIREILPRLADPELGLEPTYCIRGERWWRRSLVADIEPQARRAWLPVLAIAWLIAGIVGETSAQGFGGGSGVIVDLDVLDALPPGPGAVDGERPRLRFPGVRQGPVNLRQPGGGL